MSTPIRRALYGRLSGDTTLTGMLGTPAANYSQSIYYGQAPEKAGFPYVIFNKQSGVPTDTFTDAGAFETDVWLVKGIDRGQERLPSADNVEQIQQRLIDLLNDAPLSISGNSLMMLRRQSDVDYVEVSGEETYRHSGSLFRVMFQPVT